MEPDEPQDGDDGRRIPAEAFVRVVVFVVLLVVLVGGITYACDRAS